MAVLRPRIKVKEETEIRATPKKTHLKSRVKKRVSSSSPPLTASKTKPRVKREAKVKVKAEEQPEAKGLLDVVLLPSGNPIRPGHPLLKPPSGEHFGLIQESLSHNLFHLLIQTCLWNQTRGLQARPVLLQILTLYPTPDLLAAADLQSLTDILQPIGLHNIRAQRLIKFAQTWLDCPPEKGKRYRRVDYPFKGCGRDVKPSEVLDESDPREGWEVAHLPGVGAYAIDSYRIFIRDEFRGIDAHSDVEPEWKRVVPLDKPLRAYLTWRWGLEGWDWDPMTGKRKLLKPHTATDSG